MARDLSCVIDPVVERFRSPKRERIVELEKVDSLNDQTIKIFKNAWVILFLDYVGVADLNGSTKIIKHVILLSLFF